MRKKIIAGMLSIIVSVISIFSFDGYSSAQEIGKNIEEYQSDISLSSEASSSVLTDRLLQMLQTTRSSSIPVTIQINDDVNLDEIDKKAMENCGVTSEQLQQMETVSLGLTEEENIQYQQDMLKLYDNIRTERNRLLKAHYSKLNNAFVDKMGWNETEYASIGMYTPFVRMVNMSVEEIYDLAESGKVTMIDYGESIAYETSESAQENISRTTYPSVDSTIAIIRGNVAKNAGYTGTGVRVGVIEGGLPKTSVMGTDASNVNLVNYTSSSQLSDHTTVVCGIIKKMAPGCSVYSYYSEQESTTVEACEILIDTYNVQVINLSCGYNQDEMRRRVGNYNSYSVELDMIIKNNRVSIVVAAGNAGEDVTEMSGGQQYIEIYGEEINNFAMAPNAIAVGAVSSSGTSQSASGAYTMWDLSCYKEVAGAINRPDISAPGFVSIYSYTQQKGTSFAAPHITGTVVQMISRNSGMSDKPTILKAALLASAKYGATYRNYINYTKVDNAEGAGVVDAGFCYDVAKNGRRTHFDMTYADAECTYNVYCDTTTSPFRVACAWEVISSEYNNSVIYNDYDLILLKNGTEVASSKARYSSTGVNTNYEILELDTSKLSYWGAGYYQVKIVKVSQTSSNTFRVGLAWEQP